MTKNYNIKIFSKKNGSSKQELEIEFLSSATSKKQAFLEAKQKLFEFASYHFNSSQIKEILEDEFNEAKKNDNLDDFLNDAEVYNCTKLVHVDDVGDFTADCFDFGQLSYYYDTYFYEVKVFSKKVKN